MYNPDDYDLTTLSVGDLRKAYAFYRWAALCGAGQAVVDKQLSAATPTTPLEWIAAIKAITVKCERCRGSGVYTWGGTVNGRPIHTGECFRCGGKGWQGVADFRRNYGYDNHAIRAACA